MRLIFLLSVAVFAQGEAKVREMYTKYEYRIPMRDGKRLFTSVYVPKDASQKWPILMNRTPYTVSPYGEDLYKEDLGPNVELAKDKYIFVYQDVRGRNMSEGEFVNMTPHKAVKRGPQDIDESTDTYDTIDWLVKKLPNFFKKVNSRRKRFSLGHTTYPCSSVSTVASVASSSTPIYSGVP